jgi:hypothetical protein
VDQHAVEIVTDDEAMLEALTLAVEEVIRAIADMQPIRPSNTEAVLRPKSGRWEGEYFPFDGSALAI